MVRNGLEFTELCFNTSMNMESTWHVVSLADRLNSGGTNQNGKRTILVVKYMYNNNNNNNNDHRSLGQPSLPKWMNGCRGVFEVSGLKYKT